MVVVDTIVVVAALLVVVPTVLVVAFVVVVLVVEIAMADVVEVGELPPQVKTGGPIMFA